MTPRSRISIDVMSGDRGPKVIVAGLVEFARARPTVDFLLHGDESIIRPLIERAPDDIALRCQLRHSDKVVPMDQKPTQALRSGRHSSMWNAIQSVKENEATAVVSAGNTGALMAMSKLILRTIECLHRPALVATWPTRDGVSAILDVGADVTANAQQLAEFAVLGEAFAQAVHHKPRPRIGILNIGSENIKGFESLRMAGTILENSGLDINYCGFVEADGISLGEADVVVTDGFAGNIAIKAAEGAARLVAGTMRRAFVSSWRAKMGALMARPALRELRDFLDNNRYNGAVFAGLRGIAVKSHGGANGFGICRALHVAHDMAGHGFGADVSERLAALARVREKDPAR